MYCIKLPGYSASNSSVVYTCEVSVWAQAGARRLFVHGDEVAADDAAQASDRLVMNTTNTLVTWQRTRFTDARHRVRRLWTRSHTFSVQRTISYK